MTESQNLKLTLDGIYYDDHDGFPVEMFFIPDSYYCQLISAGRYALIKKQQIPLIGQAGQLRQQDEETHD